jgi:hypothetical protein
MIKLFSILTIFSLTIVFACKKSGSMNVCITVDKTTTKTNETVTVSDCGDAPPSGITIQLDWGDGTTKTSGKTGTHQYTKTGTFNIELYVDGNAASSKVDASNVKKSITVN